MEASSQPPSDAGALARLVLHCREFKSYVDQLASALPDRASAPFLYRQLEEQLSRLEDAVRGLGKREIEEKQSEQKRGFLRRFLGKSPEAKVDENDRFDLEGNSWTIPVSELVGFLSNTGKTGILSVDARDERFVVEIQSGVLIRATSNRTPDGLRLGELLVAHEKLTDKDVTNYVRMAREANKSLGEYLVSHGHVNEVDLRAALSVQAEGLFYRLMSAENSIYRFQDGVNLDGAQEAGLSVTQLLLEGARRKDEATESGFTTDELDESELACLDDSTQDDAA